VRNWIGRRLGRPDPQMVTVSRITLALAGAAILCLSVLAWLGIISINTAAMVNMILLLLIMSTLVWGGSGMMGSVGKDIKKQ